MLYALSLLILFFYRGVNYPENCCARDIELGKRSGGYRLKFMLTPGCQVLACIDMFSDVCRNMRKKGFAPAIQLEAHTQSRLKQLQHYHILIYQGVHCCTKVCNLHLDDSPSKSRDNRMHWTRSNLLKWKGIYKNYEPFTDQLQPIYFTCNDL